MQLKQALFESKEKAEWSRMLIMDPGITATGYAFWETLVRPGPCMPTAYGIQLGTSRRRTWEDRAEALCAWFEALMEHHKPIYVVLEFPGLWASSAKSFASASNGDLFKLTYLVGGFGEIVRRSIMKKPILVTPQQWKGQLSKKIVQKRLEKVLHKEFEDHEADAVGIGLRIQGEL